MNNEITKPDPQFDYSALDVERRERILRLEDEIDSFVRESAYQIGKRLLIAKEYLPHGQFGKWLKKRWGWSEQTARNMMNVARNFKSTDSVDLFPREALNILAAPSVPESAREEAVERAKSGEKITHEKAKELADAHKLIKEQEEEIKKREKQLEELQKQIAKLKSQLPTEDVKKQVADLEAQIRKMKENPVKVEVEKQVEVPPKDYEDLKKFKSEADEILAKSKAELEKNEKQLERLRKENKKTEEYVKRIDDLSNQVTKQKEKIALMENEKRLDFITVHISDAHKYVKKAMAIMEQQGLNRTQDILPEYLFKAIDAVIRDLNEIKKKNQIIDLDIVNQKEVLTIE